MKQAYQIFKSDSGIVFVRSDTKIVSKVSVKNENMRGSIHSYTFRNIPADTFQSPFVSWANLNCCGGWTFNEDYLLTAVQEGKKLCAGITITNDEQAVNDLANSLGGEYPYFRPPNTHNGPYTFYHIDVTRKGSISDYIDMQAVKKTYEALDLLKFLDFNEIEKYASKPMISLLDGTVDFDYCHPNGDEQLVITGLLLGYPLESTAALF